MLLIETLKKALYNIKNGTYVKDAVSVFLEAYYDDYLDLFHGNQEDFPEELCIPLHDRESGVFDAIKNLINNGYDVNEGDFNPLMTAVSHADASMTSFLIANGAKADYWPNMEEVPEPLRENWYLEEIDIAYMNQNWEHSERYVNALLETTRVLLEEGKTGSFFGLCLRADTAKKEISLGEPELRY